MEARSQLEVTKFYTECQTLSNIAIECKLANESKPENCQSHFDNYKECRKQENEKRRQSRRGKKSS